LIQLLVIPVILTIFTSLSAMAVDVKFTADNAYQLWYGTATGVTNTPISPAVVNTTGAQIGSCGTPGPESYSGISSAGGGYIYIVAWSDQAVTQGVLGQFVAGTNTTYTGIGGWEVYATGMPINPITAAPTFTLVNAQIALANSPGGGPPSTSSVHWVTQAPSTGGIGLLASGEKNDSNSGGNFFIVCQTLINPGARWMWYNRNSNGSGNPFVSPAPGEYLIFRLPVSRIVNPRAFYANKDIKNMTGATAAGVQIEVAGHHTYKDIYHATTPGFTVDATGANDKLRWTGGTIVAGAVVHVGFFTDDPVINMLGVTMLNAGGASIGCALQLNTGIHTNSHLTYHNTVTNCTASPIHFGNTWLEYYHDEVALADLVPGGARTPFQTVTLKLAPTLIAPSDTVTVPIPPAPKGAEWVVVHHEIGSTAALGETEDFLQVPIETPHCSRLYAVTNANQLAAIDVDNACATTIIGVTRDTASGPVRRIRGLAYDAVSDNMYGMTREGDLVSVNRLTAATTFLFAVSPHGSPPNFWSGLAFNGTNKLYSTNAFGAHELVEITNATSATVVGSTAFSGTPLQILGLDFYPSSAPLIPPTFNGTHPALSVLYGSNRNNDNIVVVNAGNGAVTMPMGNHTVGVNNLQEIAFHPETGALYAIHDRFSSSNNAALSTYNFTTEMSTELCELPFGIVETVGGGNDTYGWGGLAFAPCPPTPTPPPTRGPVFNISSRLQVGTADQVMIAGFIIQGSAPKQVLIRAAGPSLTQFGVPNALANPRLELHDTTNTIGTNNDWQTTQIGGVITADQVAAIQSSGLAPGDPLESAIIATLPPGSYTATVQGVSAGTGVGIVEVYDLDLTGGSILRNIATRGFVQTGNNVMIGGFILGGSTQNTGIVVRGIGPSLAVFGLSPLLADPTLELRDSNGALLISNDDWQDDPIQAAQLSARGLAPQNSKESGIFVSLPSGAFTAIVAGKNGGTGIGLVEIYNVN
jgi:hypothetical protein